MVQDVSSNAQGANNPLQGITLLCQGKHLGAEQHGSSAHTRLLFP
jgi:hypothetical protein